MPLYNIFVVCKKIDHGASENIVFDTELKKKWKIDHLTPKTQRKSVFTFEFGFHHH
jgi:hypothetical protein